MTTTISTAKIARTPEAAATALDATAEEIDRMSMSERIDFLRALRAGPAATLGAGDKWLNLEGVIAFFQDQSLGAPGTWVSHVNAGVLEGVERGIALAVDPDGSDFDNPGAREWARYLELLRTGELDIPTAHASAWSRAKKVGTDYGVALAVRHGLAPTAVEERFLRIAEGYNWAMSNRAPVDFLVAFAGYFDASLAGIDPAAVDRLFAVGSADAARRGCQIAYAAALIEPTPESLTHFRPLLAMLPSMFNTLAQEDSR
ncbi:hypothetical protein AB0C34_23500 [Nocardia sp. NPDC049220]|uniref:hypothetical protein n=1 Tax=Nocardia sp. NPDC049220 TaxID=3155273 RepID=UPI0033E80167